MKMLELRRAVMADAWLLWEWANDPLVRKNSFHMEPIPYESHLEWLQEKLASADSHIYIACVEGAPVGQIRLDVEADGVCFIDYSVAASCRGRGFGTAMVEKALHGFEGVVPGCQFRARVKTENRASVRVFEKCGFVKMAEDEGVVELEKRRRLLICTQKSWNVENAEAFREAYRLQYEVEIWTQKEELTPERLTRFSPEYVFFPHWSYLIPASVYEAYTCVVFHMTDLPFGRGGSPLQNLIVRGFTGTKVSAIRVEAGLDTGDVYCKEELELSGTAGEILKRTSDLIFQKMIPYILKHNPQPVKQTGEVVTFKRRKPEDGCLQEGMDMQTIYDYIRMLDGEGYPNAYVELGSCKIRFTEAEYRDGKLTARAEFVEEEK